MRVIHKYKLRIDDTLQELSIPEDGKLVSAAMQNDALCLWIEVDTDEEFEARFFRVIGTGHEIRNHSYSDYIATVHEPPFVWHIYEEFI